MKDTLKILGGIVVGAGITVAVSGTEPTPTVIPEPTVTPIVQEIKEEIVKPSPTSSEIKSKGRGGKR